MSAREPADQLSMVPPEVQRTAVVLLHGLCSTPDELLTVQSALRSRGYSVHPLTIEGYSFDAPRRCSARRRTSAGSMRSRRR
jgi:carboxylesterase